MRKKNKIEKIECEVKNRKEAMTTGGVWKN